MSLRPMTRSDRVADSERRVMSLRPLTLSDDVADSKQERRSSHRLSDDVTDSERQRRSSYRLWATTSPTRSGEVVGCTPTVHISLCASFSHVAPTTHHSAWQSACHSLRLAKQGQKTKLQLSPAPRRSFDKQSATTTPFAQACCGCWHRLCEAVHRLPQYSTYSCNHNKPNCRKLLTCSRS